MDINIDKRECSADHADTTTSHFRPPSVHLNTPIWTHPLNPIDHKAVILYVSTWNDHCIHQQFRQRAGSNFTWPWNLGTPSLTFVLHKTSTNTPTVTFILATRFSFTSDTLAIKSTRWRTSDASGCFHWGPLPVHLPHLHVHLPPALLPLRSPAACRSWTADGCKLVAASERPLLHGRFGWPGTARELRSLCQWWTAKPTAPYKVVSPAFNAMHPLRWCYRLTSANIVIDFIWCTAACGDPKLVPEHWQRDCIASKKRSAILCRQYQEYKIEKQQ